ncbi:ABC transporter substrate-binding protein [Sporohalobacter salinus]|uniref:ABC transporter substrate-binding protein n=1 Tax=Sporohalobacter salinus TaxID=1494606 RepID=UPI001960CD8E|nr:ABC transporter substrate-binding protein [Sporohalobacter salinus]MBM7622862.1 peptide/nickel transport system substrate-binding protein/oligopeptide transport system substrate-binding protein [Sporohalobacter salinus]
MLKRSLSVLLVLALVSFAIVGCASNKQVNQKAKEEKKSKTKKVTEEEKYGGTFKARVASDPPTLDPAHSTDTTSSRVIRNIFDGLVQYNEKLEVVPAIAKSWDVGDKGLEWTFHLRKGAKFHNGREITADDVVYSFTRLLDPDTQSERAWLFERVKGSKAFQEGKTDQVKGLKAVDKYTVKIILKKPFTPFLSMLCMGNASIVPKEVVKEKGDHFAQAPVGSGPFKFVSWQHDNKVVLKKNEDYYVDGRPYLDQVVYRVIKEGTAAFAEYEQGNIHVMIQGDIPSGQIDRVTDPNGEFADEYALKNRLGIYYIGFNTQKEPFTNKKVRQAINYAINKKAITQVVKDGLAKSAIGILPPGMPGYNENLKGYSYNIEKAKKLLKEAGYSDGLPGTYELTYNTSKNHQRVAEAVQSNLKKIGVNVKLNNMDWGTYIQKLDKGETEMYRFGWIGDYPDPDNFLRVLFHSDNAGPGGNASFYKNPEVDKMLEEAAKMNPGQKRLNLYQKIEKKIMDDAPWIPVYYYATPYLEKIFVNDYIYTPQNVLPLTSVWLDPDKQ